VANEPRFASVPPARIVPMLADEGIYLASESTFSRVLKAHGQTPTVAAPRRPRHAAADHAHRHRARARSGAGT
jgi:putative transposase